MTTELFVVGIRDEAGMHELAGSLAEMLGSGDVIGLRGTLGAGKTTLVRGIIQSMMQEEEEIPSPTFSLVQNYDTGVAPVWHFDLYRLEEASEVWELGFEEALEEAICLIEWPDKAAGLIPDSAIYVEIEMQSDGSRKVTFRTDDEYSQIWSDRLALIKNKYRDKIGG